MDVLALPTSEELRLRALDPGGFDDPPGTSPGMFRRHAWLALLDVPRGAYSEQACPPPRSSTPSLSSSPPPLSDPPSGGEGSPSLPSPPETPLIQPSTLPSPKLSPSSHVGQAYELAHPDEDQVKLDVRRSLVSFCGAPSSADRSEKLAIRAARRAQLYDLIVSTLRSHRSLAYYQGYHDLVAVLLLTLVPSGSSADCPHHGVILYEGQPALWPSYEAEHEAKSATSRLSLHLLRDFHTPSLQPALGHLYLLNTLLRGATASLVTFASAGPEGSEALPLFALSWSLTFFCHGLRTFPAAQRVMDALLAHGPLFALKLGAALLTRRVQEVEGDPEMLEDPNILHHALQQLPAIVPDAPGETPTGPGRLGPYSVPLPPHAVGLSTVLRFASGLPWPAVEKVMYEASVLRTWPKNLGRNAAPRPWRERDEEAIDLLMQPAINVEALAPPKGTRQAVKPRRPAGKPQAQLLLSLAGVMGAVGVGLVLFQSSEERPSILSLAAEAWRSIAA